jgi:hypothetical protein
VRDRECRDRRNQPVMTIMIPITTPINIPILIRRINIPSNNPNTMAKIKATSPLFTSGLPAIDIILFNLSESS